MKFPSCTFTIHWIINFSPGVTCGSSALAFSRAELTSTGLRPLNAIHAHATAIDRIFLDGGAPVFVAALKIKILVVLHALLIKLAPLGGTRGHRHRSSSGLGFGGLVLGKSSTSQDAKGNQPSQDAALHHQFLSENSDFADHYGEKRSIEADGDQGDGRFTTGGVTS